MKRLWMTAVITAMTAQVWANGDTPPTFTEWHDQQVNEVNRFPLHTNFFTYENSDVALKGNMATSANFLSLDGDWKFNWVANADQRPTDFYKTAYDAVMDVIKNESNIPSKVRRNILVPVSR